MMCYLSFAKMNLNLLFVCFILVYSGDRNTRSCSKGRRQSFLGDLAQTNPLFILK